MINYFITKSFLEGEIIIPPSKSQTMRAILFGSLSNGNSIIKNFLSSKDTISFIEGCENFNAKIDVFENILNIQGTNQKINLKKNKILDVNNSGIALRFLTSIYSLGNEKIIIRGDSSIENNRSLKPLIETLEDLNVEFQFFKKNNFAPLSIKGPIFKKNEISILGYDSQYVSSILIALSLFNDDFILKVEDPNEKPFVDMTLSWLKKFNLDITNQNYKKFIIKKGFSIEAFEYSVPTDFSTLLFVVVAALITKSEITIKNVVFDEDQKDFLVLDILKNFGANIDINKDTIVVKKSILTGSKIVDINDYIDALPILSVFGCFVDSLTLINAKNAKHKESNRIFAITKELRKMNANIIETEDGVIIKKSILKNSKVSSHKDHRIALSLIVASLAISGTTEVQDIECIDKTYPNFKNDFLKIGANIL